MPTITRRSLFILPWASRSLLASQASGASKRPNILFIMTDDHAAQAISCYGSKVNRTPHLDRIASEGMRMNRVFATNSICTPSRATILTGKYSHMNGVPVFNRFEQGDIEAESNHRPFGGTAGIVPDAFLPGVPAQIPDDEEVGIETHLVNNAQFVIQPRS